MSLELFDLAAQLCAVEARLETEQLMYVVQNTQAATIGLPGQAWNDFERQRVRSPMVLENLIELQER